jgi:hypothetical protein
VTLGFELVAAQAEVEITITAFGRRDSFPSVMSLVEACPSLPGVRLCAFRQLEGPDFELELGGHAYSPRDTWFEPTRSDDPMPVGVQILFPGADDVPADERLQAACIMLQTILGEYGAATRLEHVEVANTRGIN